MNSGRGTWKRRHDVPLINQGQHLGGFNGMEECLEAVFYSSKAAANDSVRLRTWKEKKTFVTGQWKVQHVGTKRSYRAS